jgi:dTDP-4-dehydrorhamnose reductase
MPPILDPISTEDFGARAPRPRNSRLDLGKIERVYGLRPRNWQTALADVIEELRLEDTTLRAS